MIYSHSRPHLILAPQTDPPYDDETAQRPTEAGLERRGLRSGHGVQAVLAYSFARPDTTSEVPRAAQPLRLATRDGEIVAPARHDGVDRARPVGSPGHAVVRPLRPHAPASPPVTPPRQVLPASGSPTGSVPQASPRRTPPRSTLADPWLRQLVQAIVEALAGTRTLGQLHAWTSEEVYEAVRYRYRTTFSRPGRRPVVRSVHVDEPKPGVAEVCAVLRCGSRGHAMALRFEDVEGRWLCTALELK